MRGAWLSVKRLVFLETTTATRSTMDETLREVVRTETMLCLEALGESLRSWYATATLGLLERVVEEVEG
jgi:hypothetical protein